MFELWRESTTAHNVHYGENTALQVILYLVETALHVMPCPLGTQHCMWCPAWWEHSPMCDVMLGGSTAQHVIQNQSGPGSHHYQNLSAATTRFTLPSTTKWTLSDIAIWSCWWPPAGATWQRAQDTYPGGAGWGMPPPPPGGSGGSGSAWGRSASSACPVRCPWSWHQRPRRRCMSWEANKGYNTSKKPTEPTLLNSSEIFFFFRYIWTIMKRSIPQTSRISTVTKYQTRLKVPIDKWWPGN